MSDLLSELTQLDVTRRQNYDIYLNFYDGKQWPSQTPKVKQLTFNYLKVFIDKISSYLIHDISYAVDPIDDSEESKSNASKAEAAIAEVAEFNDLPALDYDTEVDCAILGDACYKVTWSQVDKQVKITSPDVKGIWAWWMPDDPSIVYQVVSQYPLPDKSLVTEQWTNSVFTQYINAYVVQRIKNPYGFIPFIIFPNLRDPKHFWGYSDVKSFMNTQQELNRAISQVSRILELSGNPIAVLENITESEDISVQPGAVWNIPEDAKAYLLDLLKGGGWNLHMEYIELLYRINHDLSESPKAAYGRTERDLSGIALEMEMQPLLQKVRRKRLIRNSAYRRRNEMIIALLERFTGSNFAECRHRISWGEVLPLDTGRTVDEETRLVLSGIHSRETAADILGIIDPQAEFHQWLNERDSIMGQNQRFGVKGSKSSERESQTEA